MLTRMQYNNLKSNDKPIEARIDKALREGKGSTKPITIAVSLFKDVERSQLENVLAKYRTSGWRCEIVDDSRDGDFIQFKP